VIRRLIVNADDFGVTRGVSEGILDASRHGIVTSTTALVTLSIEPEHVKRARDSALGIGLHVNLTLGTPLTRGASLVDESGRFVRDPLRAATRARAREVDAEVAAQVERFIDLFGRPPTHLDSHHHVAMFSPVRESVLATARRLGVAVRSQDTTVRARTRSAGLRTTDHFFGEAAGSAYWTPARTLVRLSALPPGVSEFMAHPGRFDDALAGSRYGRQREVELVGLGTPSARAAAAALGVRLCHFGDL
jgi:chitin disaccharide deacetylase